ncbi:MAG TPA: hypothetical protein VJT71_06685, partial [Pyrinomonadaceae bacterium]|nr:hypothetical protein [Pyrinomonadaceae bacterium]
AAHVQACTKCNGLAGEYRQTSQLLGGFATPAFSEGVYSGIRERVLREIETKPPHATDGLLTRLFGGLFQPRIGWAVASALLLAVGLFAFYFMTNRAPVNGPQAKVPPHTPAPITSSSPVAPPAGVKKPPVKTVSPETARFKRRVRLADRGPSVASNKRPEPQIRSEAASDSNNNAEPVADQSSEKVFRLEMQTKDPNVRIIWFTPKRTTNKISRGV